MVSQCPRCGKIENVPAEFAGRTIECGCGQSFTLKDDSHKESVQRDLIASEFVVTDYRIGKSKRTDQYHVRFACGFCKGSIILNRKQLAKQQQKCKECGKGYRLSKKILADVKEQELTDKRNKEELVLKKQEAKAEKRLARRKREREQQLRVPRRGTNPRCVSCGTILSSKGSQELCILCSAPALEAKAKVEKSAAARGKAIARRKAIHNAKAEMSAAFEAKAEKSAAAERSNGKLWKLAVWAVLLGVPAVHFIYWDSQGVSLEDAALKFLTGAFALVFVVGGLFGIILIGNIPLGSIKIGKHIDVDDDGTNDFTFWG